MKYNFQGCAMARFFYHLLSFFCLHDALFAYSARVALNLKSLVVVVLSFSVIFELP